MRSAETVGPGETIQAAIEVAKVGDREGSTVVQFYIADEQASVVRPNKELKRFAKVWLTPNEKRTITMNSTCAASRFTMSSYGRTRPVASWCSPFFER
jgi:beta-glucosidase